MYEPRRHQEIRRLILEALKTAEPTSILIVAVILVDERKAA